MSTLAHKIFISGKYPWLKITLAVIGLGLVLLMVNINIAKKEQTLTTGDDVLLELIPVDPRSLMQGDYMALDYQIASDISKDKERLAANSNRVNTWNYQGYVIVKKDRNNVAHFVRLSPHDTITDIQLEPDEMALFYRTRQGRVKFATNAFFFQEGHAEVYEEAKYGLFKVDKEGKPLLTHLVDDSFQVINPE